MSGQLKFIDATVCIFNGLTRLLSMYVCVHMSIFVCICICIHVCMCIYSEQRQRHEIVLNGASKRRRAQLLPGGSTHTHTLRLDWTLFQLFAHTLDNSSKILERSCSSRKRPRTSLATFSSLFCLSCSTLSCISSIILSIVHRIFQLSLFAICLRFVRAFAKFFFTAS